MREYFENQMKLLLNVLGIVSKQNPSFALKGGTAINVFHSNLPRLSVDIDLAYTKITSREDFLRENESFQQILCNRIKEERGFLSQIKRTKDGIAKQISVESKKVGIKIETNLVLRGVVYPTVIKETCDRVKKEYMTEMEIRTLSFEDLYAGKFCAALDRQHPRDLFDVLMFFQEQSITEKLKVAFLAYLLSGNRPISEMIHPNRLDQRQAFENEFMGMTDIVVTYEQLEKAREQLIDSVDEALTQEDRQFLLSFKMGEPKWDYLGLDYIKDMPSIKWKLANIKKMPKSKHKEAVEELRRKLEK